MKPMTPETVALLRRMADDGRLYLASGSGDISRARSLRTRGYAHSTGTGGPWRATLEGLAALEDQPKA